MYAHMYTRAHVGDSSYRTCYITICYLSAPVNKCYKSCIYTKLINTPYIIIYILFYRCVFT